MYGKGRMREKEGGKKSFKWELVELKRRMGRRKK
jgi:hypothetical protein